MAKTIVISGGNSGIGLEAGRQLAKEGHHVVLLGRDPAKGAAALETLRNVGGTAEFIAADLATHAGVKAAAETLSAKFPTIDGLILGAGVLFTHEARTADGLHPVFATNYLSRYHLAQRLLPNLRAAGHASVSIIVAGVPLDAKIDFAAFPKFQPFPGFGALSAIQIANFHYAAALAKAEPTIRVGVMNVGLVKTEIMRAMPAPMRFGFWLLGPLMTIPVAKAAANPVWFTTNVDAPTGHYFAKPGQHASQALSFDPAVTEKVLAASRELTGA